MKRVRGSGRIKCDTLVEVVRQSHKRDIRTWTVSRKPSRSVHGCAWTVADHRTHATSEVARRQVPGHCQEKLRKTVHEERPVIPKGKKWYNKSNIGEAASRGEGSGVGEGDK